MADKETILIVDDSKVNREVLCRILKEDDYQLLQAENGREALDLLEKDDTQVDLVLLDIVMPVMDGYEFLQVMEETGRLASLPVIVITGNEDSDTEVRCLRAGASDFIKKPFNGQLARYRVESILRLWDNAKLVNHLEKDRLTGLYNRASFYVHAEEALRAAPDAHFVMLYVNIEEFKLINAHYGKKSGDELLQYLAGILRSCMGPDGVCGRIGADIFAVLVKHGASFDQHEGSHIADSLKDAPVKGVSVKCGVYPVVDATMSIADMCDRAKIAQESISRKYGVYYAMYDDSMQEKALREHQLANYMEEALEQRQFLVYLQPKHTTQSGAVAGAEALVRWVHPELGFISPGEFIPLFEKNGFIVKLDYFVWDEVCRTLHKWIQMGLKPVPVSVNASRADFLSPDLPEKIADLVERYDIPPELLHVEVTESAYTDNPQQIISAVSLLRDMGFEIEMDDFGSGYSSLNMLSELPIDILKLDMRFMQTGNDRLKASKRNILSFIVSLSKWLQLPTVAEGVETVEEFDVLKAMGCNLIQGYFFAKPMPIDEFESYMVQHAEPKPVPPVETVEDELLLHPESAGTEKPLVLVVEDIESNREVMRALLSAEYRIDTAENGEVAYRYIQAHSMDLSCILLDLLMPVMDGFQLLEKLHADPELSEIPVIITTETGNNSELRALNLGAHSFVAKPYNPDVLRHHVRKAVEEKSFLKFKHAFEQQNTQLVKKAYRDELTSLLNRFGLKEAMQRLPEGKTHTLVLMDVDNLKAMNDTHGHAAGDALLSAIAGKLRACTREGDILARIGGDEFIVILRGMDEPARALKKVQGLCRAVSEITIPETQTHPSCSAGVTMLADAAQYDTCYQEADKALYEAKTKDRGRCCLWAGESTPEK